MKRVLIAAGGTGGHFYPGLVAALELKRRGWEPLLVVKKDDPAKAKLESAGLPCLEVDLRGLPRSAGPELFSFAWKLLGSLRLLAKVGRDFKPDLVLGMGGYLTFPCAYAAWKRGVPLALHESNAILGLANKASLRFGATLFWGLPPVAGEGAVVGTPVRPELFHPKAKTSTGKSVLVFGGSQGAKALNRGFAAAAKSSGVAMTILHLAGRGKSEETKAAYAASGVAATVLDYSEDMATAYAGADLVVCRSGASTLAELAAQRKFSVLVPYPHAAANHQDANARVFERNGTALRIPETDLSNALGPALADLLKSPPSPDWTKLGLPAADRTTVQFADALERLTRQSIS